MASQSVLDRVETPYVSTGHLPRPDIVQSLVDEAHHRFEANTDGKNSDVYRAPARIPRGPLGVCIIGLPDSRAANARELTT